MDPCIKYKKKKRFSHIDSLSNLLYERSADGVTMD